MSTFTGGNHEFGTASQLPFSGFATPPGKWGKDPIRTSIPVGNNKATFLQCVAKMASRTSKMCIHQCNGVLL